MLVLQQKSMQMFRRKGNLLQDNSRQNIGGMIMDFKSQICTTREQSERLTALGLKKETADMHHYRWSEGYWDIQACPPRGDSSSFIPAWSLHRLWELANLRHIVLDSGDEIPILYDEVIAFMESEIKEGMFNKNYLED